jgi:hypothetical protein
MTKQIHRRYDLAANQLETAIGLFIAGQDRFSVITLAGAADTVLSQLVQNAGKQNFIDSVLEQSESEDRDRRKMAKHVNDVLFINELKHMDDGDDGRVEMDLEQCAIASVLVAIANFVSLNGRGAVFIETFLAWVKANLDPAIWNINCEPNWKPTATKGNA